MRNLDKYLKNKTINYDKLLEYGFIKENRKYLYKKNILNNKFLIEIEISSEKQVSKVIDKKIEEEYILVDVDSSTGEFVGKIKKEYEDIINDIVNKCTSKNAFKNKQTIEVINYIKEKYNDDLEFLWEKYDDAAIVRNKNNNKWYILFMTVSESKLGLESYNISEIIDLRYQKDIIETIVDNKIIFKGYHMNKKSWITIKLDNSMKLENIFTLIDNSYILSTK